MSDTFTKDEVEETVRPVVLRRVSPARIKGDHLWVLDEYGVYVPITTETGRAWWEAVGMSHDEVIPRDPA